MSQLKHQFQSIQPFPQKEQFHIIEHNGKQIAMVPMERLSTLQSHDFAYRVVAVGVALGAIAVGVSMLVPAMKPAAPVIVDRPMPPVIVDRNCIAFCGN